MTKDTYLDDMATEIRNEWFKDHKAYVTGKEGFQQINWSKGNFAYRTKYILSGNNIFISGDIGEAVYTLTCAATLENIKDFNLGYFTGKLTALGRGSKYNFNSSLAKRQLGERLIEYELDGYENTPKIRQVVSDAIEESHTMDSYNFWLQHCYMTSGLSYDDIEEFFDLGKELRPSVIAYWVGLKMIIEQLDILKIDIEEDDENEII